MSTESAWAKIGREKSMRELRSRMYYTPDIKDIQEYDYFIVFIDGILKREYHNSSMVLSNSKFLGVAVTLEDNFVMKRTAQYPATFWEKKNLPVNRKVLGEAYAVPLADLLRLDVVLANTSIYKRETHVIKLLDQRVAMKNGEVQPTIDAWMYLGVPEYFENQSMALAPMELYRQKMAYKWWPEPWSS